MATLEWNRERQVGRNCFHQEKKVLPSLLLMPEPFVSTMFKTNHEEKNSLGPSTNPTNSRCKRFSSSTRIQNFDNDLCSFSYKHVELICGELIY